MYFVATFVEEYISKPGGALPHRSAEFFAFSYNIYTIQAVRPLFSAVRGVLYRTSVDRAQGHKPKWQLRYCRLKFPSSSEPMRTSSFPDRPPLAGIAPPGA